jgi:hypothetical protein
MPEAGSFCSGGNLGLDFPRLTCRGSLYLRTMYFGTLPLMALLRLNASVPRTTTVRRKLNPHKAPVPPQGWGRFLTELAYGIWPEAIRFHRSGRARNDSPQLHSGRLHRVFLLMNVVKFSSVHADKLTLPAPLFVALSIPHADHSYGQHLHPRTRGAPTSICEATIIFLKLAV